MGGKGILMEEKCKLHFNINNNNATNTLNLTKKTLNLI